MSSSISKPTSDPLAVARVMGVRGLKGDLRVMSLTDTPERLSVGEGVIVEGVCTREITEARRRSTAPSSLEGIRPRPASDQHLMAPLPDELPAGTY
jgi:hypothetical protein